MSIHKLEGPWWLDTVYVRDQKKTLQVYDVSHCSQYSAPIARDIKGSTKWKLLETSSTYTTEASRMLAALESIDKETRALFGPKQDAYNNFSFRLLQNEDTTILPDERIENFIALSYTWHSPTWKPHSSICPLHQDANGPLTPAMWAALLAQLEDYECFWIDQLCITQSSESEKAAAIGSMDLVYQSARKVVVALEDIAITTTDADLMFRYANTGAPESQIPEYDRQELATTFGKIIAARWFDRAWCLHEFLVSKRHVFLVPIWQVGSRADSVGLSKSIMRIDGPFLVHLYHIFIKQDIEYQNTGRGSLLTSKKLTGAKIDKIRRFFNRLRALEMHEVFESERPLEDGSFMHMFHQVFSHDAMYNADKISIVLNAMRSGIYLKHCASFNEDECLWLVTLVAMAAGDTTTLTTNGPCSIDSNRESRTRRQWLQIPTLEDQARRTGALTIPRTTMDVKIVEEGLELEVLFLGTNVALKSAPQHYLSIARWLIDHRALCEMSIDEQQMRIDTEPDEALYAALRIAYIQSLACALTCGKDWMLLHHAKSYVSLPGTIQLQWSSASKQQFVRAINWGLATTIERDIGDDLAETWQDEGTLMWADDITQVQEEESAGDSCGDESYSRLNQDEQLSYTILLDFTETLINFGVAVFPRPNDAQVWQEVWAVRILDIPETSTALIYAPAASTQAKLHLGVPKALGSDAYDWMSRLWLLREEKKNSQYSLRGKSRLAGISSLPDLPSMRVTVVGGK